MFIIEYRTIKRSATTREYSSKFMNVGAHKALSCQQAKEYAQLKLGSNVEIIACKYIGVL